MGRDSSIEWTNHTFNPWWGCTKVSPACAHCYAESWAKRVGQEIWGDKAPRRLFSDKHWKEPLAWDNAAKRSGIRRRVFCASMADVFEGRKDLDAWRERLWQLIAETPNLDWLLLTKRPENAVSMVPWSLNWPSTVWLGTTVENQEWAERRIPYLVTAPATMRFLSCEPLIGPLNLSQWLASIDWVIVGGESGHYARPMLPSWVNSLRDQVTKAEVAFHFKQWGTWLPVGDRMERVGKRIAGRILDDRTWDEFPTIRRLASIS